MDLVVVSVVVLEVVGLGFGVVVVVAFEVVGFGLGMVVFFVVAFVWNMKWNFQFV